MLSITLFLVIIGIGLTAYVFGYSVGRQDEVDQQREDGLLSHVRLIERPFDWRVDGL